MKREGWRSRVDRPHNIECYKLVLLADEAGKYLALGSPDSPPAWTLSLTLSSIPPVKCPCLPPLLPPPELRRTCKPENMNIRSCLTGRQEWQLSGFGQGVARDNRAGSCHLLAQTVPAMDQVSRFDGDRPGWRQSHPHEHSPHALMPQATRQGRALDPSGPTCRTSNAVGWCIAYLVL